MEKRIAERVERQRRFIAEQKRISVDETPAARDLHVRVMYAEVPIFGFF